MSTKTLHWRHNDHCCVSNHQSHDCLLNRLFWRKSKKTSKLCVTGLCAGNSAGPVNSPHKGLVTRKMVPFDDVIMIYTHSCFMLLLLGTGQSYPYSLRFQHMHWIVHTLAPVLVIRRWRKSINMSQKSPIAYKITTIKQSTTRYVHI